MPVKIARCENAGKKTLFEKQSNSSEWKLSLDFEYTTRDTPQQNSLAGVIFVMIGNCGYVMMIYANILFENRYKLFKEAFTCDTFLD